MSSIVTSPLHAKPGGWSWMWADGKSQRLFRTHGYLEDDQSTYWSDSTLYYLLQPDNGSNPGAGWTKQRWLLHQDPLDVWVHTDLLTDLDWKKPGLYEWFSTPEFTSKPRPQDARYLGMSKDSIEGRFFTYLQGTSHITPLLWIELKQNRHFVCRIRFFEPDQKKAIKDAEQHLLSRYKWPWNRQENGGCFPFDSSAGSWDFDAFRARCPVVRRSRVPRSLPSHVDPSWADPIEIEDTYIRDPLQHLPFLCRSGLIDEECERVDYKKVALALLKALEGPVVLEPDYLPQELVGGKEKFHSPSRLADRQRCAAFTGKEGSLCPSKVSNREGYCGKHRSWAEESENILDYLSLKGKK